MKVFGRFCKGWPALHQEQAVHQQIRGNTQEPVAKSLVNFIHTSELQPISISSTLTPCLAAMQFVRLRFEGCWFGSLCLLKSLERRSVFDCMQQLFNGQSFLPNWAACVSHREENEGSLHSKGPTMFGQRGENSNGVASKLLTMTGNTVAPRHKSSSLIFSRE